jgi:hypothetical protein
VSIPLDRWQLWTYPGRELLAERLLEDLLVWWAYEFSETLIGTEVRRGRIHLSRPAAESLAGLRELYPEWLNGAAYLSIPRAVRKQRLKVIYGDLPLAVEPSLTEIPRDIYGRLRLAKLCGGPAVVLGENSTYLLLLKVHGWLPLEHRQQLVSDYLALLAGKERSGGQIRVSGKGGIAHRRRRELAMLGRYRLLEDNNFDLPLSLEAAQLDTKRSARVYRASRQFVEGLWPRRWGIFEELLCPIGGPPPIERL